MLLIQFSLLVDFYLVFRKLVVEFSSQMSLQHVTLMNRTHAVVVNCSHLFLP